jgi:hypothetical protein
MIFAMVLFSESFVNRDGAGRVDEAVMNVWISPQTSRAGRLTWAQSR